MKVSALKTMKKKINMTNLKI